MEPKEFGCYIGEIYSLIKESNTPFRYLASELKVEKNYPKSLINVSKNLFSYINEAAEVINDARQEVVTEEGETELEELSLDQLLENAKLYNLLDPYNLEEDVMFIYIMLLEITAAQLQEAYQDVFAPYIEKYGFVGYGNHFSLATKYQEWRQGYEQQLTDQLDAANWLQEQNRALSETYTDYPHDQFDKKIKNEADISYKGEPMRPDIGFRFYLNEHTNDRVIMIQYSYEGTEYYKIHKDDYAEYYLKLKEITIKPNFLRLVISPKEGKNINLNNISKLDINTETGVISYNVNLTQISSEELGVLLSEMGLTLSNERTSNIVTTIKIYAGPIEYSTLMDYLLNSFSNQFAYMEEATSSVASRSDNKPILYYRYPPRELYSSLFMGRLPDNLTAQLSILPSVSRKPDLPAGSPIITLNISKAENQETLNCFIETMKALIGGYLLSAPVLLQEYRDVGIELTPPVRPLTGNDAFKQARNAGATFIPQGYSRLCPDTATVKRLPIIVAEDEIAEYESQVIQTRTGAYSRKVLNFPDYDDQGNRMETNLWVTCVGESHPFVKYMNNKIDIPKGVKGPLPCCNAEPDKQVSEYKATYVATTSHHITSKGKSTGVSNLLGTVLKSVFISTGTVKRFGVAELGSNNSLLECVLYALSGARSTGGSYLPGNEQIEGILQQYKDYFQGVSDSFDFPRLRTEIASQVESAVCKQELYDLSSALIEESFSSDQNLTMDYYRMLEEFFNIKLYFFGEENMIIPRNRYYHAEVMKERDCVLIYTHNMTHFEILSLAGKLIYGQEVNEQVHLIMRQIQLVYNYASSEPASNGWAYPEDVHSQLLNEGYVLIGQYIDNAGKNRAFVGLLPDGTGPVTMELTVPSQPVNLPIAVELPFSDVVLEEETRFKLLSPGGETGLFLPSPALVTVGQRSSLEEKRIIILQLLIWLYELYRKDRKEESSQDLIDEFIETQMLHGDEEQDPYNFDDIKYNYTLPHEGYQAALDYLSKTGLVREGDRIYIYSEKMYQGVKYYFKIYAETTEGLDHDLLIPTKLNKLFVTEESIPRAVGELVFLSRETFNIWIQNYIAPSGRIYEDVMAENWLLTNFYPLKLTGTDEVVLIQNVQSPINPLVAASAAYNWQAGVDNQGYVTGLNSELFSNPVTLTTLGTLPPAMRIINERLNYTLIVRLTEAGTVPPNLVQLPNAVYVYVITLTPEGWTPMGLVLVPGELYVIKDHDTAQYAAVLYPS